MSWLGSDRGSTPRRSTQARYRSLFVLALALPLACRSGELDSDDGLPDPVIFGETMGTTYTVRLARPVAASTLASLREGVEQVLDGVNERLSTYLEDSELSRLNRAEGGVAFEASEPLFELLVHSRRISEMTDGAFDVTVAPLVRRWGFGAGANPSTDPPTESEIDYLLARIGMSQLRLIVDGRRIEKLVDDVEVDLSAIAKGYAVDRVAEHLESQGKADFMVEVGGEIVTRGVNADGIAWRIAIEKPVPDLLDVHRIVGLSDLAMATSGDYRNFYEVDGVIYSHLIDPRLGRPVAHRLASVSVIHESCAEADALASGLLVLGDEAAISLADERGLKVLLQVRRQDGSFQERLSPAMARFLDNEGR